jgi:hypothetical protein
MIKMNLLDEPIVVIELLQKFPLHAFKNTAVSVFCT